MRRVARWVLAVAGIQAALMGVYLLVERERTAPDAPALGTAAPRRVDRPLPPLEVRTREGRRQTLSGFRRPTLVHVWATWCPPCREELPGLLAIPERHPLDVVAIALDEDWGAVAAFVGAAGGGDAVVFGEGPSVARGLEVGQLPLTVLVTSAGREVLRFDGARDWTDHAWVDGWLDETEPAPRRRPPGGRARDR